MNAETTKDTIEQFAVELDDSNNVVDHEIKHYPDHDYDSIVVTFTPKGYNFVLLRSNFRFDIEDIHAVAEDGNISAVIHVHDSD